MTLKERLAKQFADYPRIALITYLVMSVATIIGFSIAIGLGVGPSTATGILGVIGAGWLAAKATMPLRILATLALTPLVAAVVKRIGRGRRGPDDNDDDADADADADAPVDSSSAPERSDSPEPSDRQA